MIKMTIGEIADRYTICRLKLERTDINCSAELALLKQELDQYKDIDTLVEKLYITNGDIWLLESDIRKGKEKLLGLEEVGRRALKIRDLNGIRVQTKNEINLIFNEGFIEIKSDHASQLN